MTSSVILNRFLNELGRRGKSPNTLSAYATDLKQFAGFLNETSLKRLSPTNLSGFTRHIANFSVNTQARKLSSIREFLRWAHQQDYTDENLSDHIPAPKRYSRNPVRSLSSSQIERLRRNATPMERLLLELVLQTGMRLRDVVALHSKHVSSRMLIIPSSRLKLPLIGPLQKAVARYRIIRSVGDRSAMISNAHGRPISVRTATTILKNLARRAGVRNATARNLRTTFIVRQLAEGISPIIIQRIIGHSSLETTQQYASLNRRITRSGPLALASL